MIISIINTIKLGNISKFHSVPISTYLTVNGGDANGYSKFHSVPISTVKALNFLHGISDSKFHSVPISTYARYPD